MLYQKYIVIESLIEELHGMDLSDEERQHLASLVDSSLHHAILDEILSNLSIEDKKIFLMKMSQDPEDDKLMEFLNERVENIEDKIKSASEQLVKELHKDIKEAKQK
ncbi:MAG: Uncharacterized protein CEO21_15 [Microgenomates group bacterium Gr01-1014_80]|nr:MAG: Uncharacterized protein CEO21_15 [Microgenomates group bacterium Gr01-1014_80]